MRRTTLATTAWSLLAVGLLAAQDSAVTFKIFKPTVGTTIEVSESDEKTSKITFKVKDKSQTKDEKETSTFRFKEEILEVDAKGKPTKLQRTYTTADITRGGKREDLKLTGKSIIAEKKNDKFEFTTTDSKPLEASALEYLVSKFRNYDKEMSASDLFPEKPIKPGESWKISPDRLGRVMGDSGLTLDPEKSTGTGKLLKAYEKNGKLFADFEMTLDLAVKQVGTGKSVVPMKAGSNLKVEMTATGCIDGTESTGQMKMKMSGELLGDLPTAELTLTLNTTGTRNTVELKKKK